MKRSKVLATGLGLMVAFGATFGLAACSSDGGAGGDASQSAQAADIDVAEDLQTARQAVLDALADDPTWAKVMLASDVDQPTQKYGLLVMPFVPSEAVEHVTGTVTIEDGNFVIEGTSVATETTYQIDQDGTITEVTE